MALGVHYSNMYILVLKYSWVVAMSQMGGEKHRVDMLLQLGFLARGITVTVTAPVGMTILGHGPPPSPVTSE